MLKKSMKVTTYNNEKYYCADSVKLYYPELYKHTSVRHPGVKHIINEYNIDNKDVVYVLRNGMYSNKWYLSNKEVSNAKALIKKKRIDD